MSEKSKIIVILGPTASGKSDVAVSLALKFNGEVISADSRQVYKKLDIGTGKITKKEMRGVPHHLLDVTNPQKRFTAADFINLTNKTIVQIINKVKVPIVCGGTGFYIDVLLGEKQLPEVPPNEKLRAKLENKSVEELFKMLQKLDPERSLAIDRYNPRRLVRAIEICEALGPNSASRFAQATLGKKVPSKYNVIKIGIKTNEKDLKKRIDKRIDKWFKAGLLKEVKNLHQKGLSWKRMTELGLEYKIVANFLRGPLRKKVSRRVLDTLQLKKEMSEKTWQYAKRQMTWFKRDEKTKWFTLSKVEGLSPKINLIEKEVKKFLDGGPTRI